MIFPPFDYGLDFFQQSFFSVCTKYHMWQVKEKIIQNTRNVEAVLQVIGECVRDAALPQSEFQYHLQTFLQ